MDTNTISTGCNGVLQLEAGGEGEDGSPGVVIGPDGKPIPAAVPEPGTLILLGTGVAGLVARRRRSARA